MKKVYLLFMFMFVIVFSSCSNVNIKFYSNEVDVYSFIDSFKEAQDEFFANNSNEFDFQYESSSIEEFNDNKVIIKDVLKCDDDNKIFYNETYHGKHKEYRYMYELDDKFYFYNIEENRVGIDVMNTYNRLYEMTTKNISIKEFSISAKSDYQKCYVDGNKFTVVIESDSVNTVEQVVFSKNSVEYNYVRKNLTNDNSYKRTYSLKFKEQNIKFEKVTN